MRRGLIVGLVLMIAALGGLAAYLVGSPAARDMLRPRQVLKDQAAIQKTAIGYVGNPYKDDYEMSRISGYVDNLSEKRLDRVVFEIRLVDQKGNKRETVLYTVRDVGGRSRKTFDANAGQIDGSRSAQAKITEIEVVK